MQLNGLKKCKQAPFGIIKHMVSFKWHFCFEVGIFHFDETLCFRGQSDDFANSGPPSRERGPKASFGKIF